MESVFQPCSYQKTDYLITVNSEEIIFRIYVCKQRIDFDFTFKIALRINSNIFTGDSVSFKS